MDTNALLDAKVGGEGVFAGSLGGVMVELSLFGVGQGLSKILGCTDQGKGNDCQQGIPRGGESMAEEGLPVSKPDAITSFCMIRGPADVSLLWVQVRELTAVRTIV